MIDWIKKREGLIFLILGAIILRIPSLFEPYWYGDEGIYLTLGLAVRKGLVLYRDIHDNKPPLLYLVAAIAGSQFWFRFVLLWWQVVNVVIFYRLAKLLFRNSKKLLMAMGSMFILLTILWEGNIANGEIFMILPVTVGMLWIWKLSEQKIKNWNMLLGYLLSGIMFSLGFLFKIPVAFDFVAAAIFLLLSTGSIRKMFGKMFSWELILFVVGFVLPIICSLAYYATQGAFGIYLNSALLQNVGYLQSWSTGSHAASGAAAKSGLLLRAIFLGAAVIGIWMVSLKKTDWQKKFQFVALWFVFSLFGALLSERPYPHYLIQIAIPAALMMGLLMTGRQRIVKGMVLILFLVTGLAYLKIGFWQYPVLNYYENFIKWATRKETKQDYFAGFEPKVNDIYEVAKFVRLQTSANDRIFIWGDEPFVYALAERLPVGRYTVAYHVVDFNGYTETMMAIKDQLPPIVIVMEGEQRPFMELMAELNSNYIQTKKIGNYMIYQRL